MRPQGLAARWAARPLDVDPFQLPARFALPLCEASGRPPRLQDSVVISGDSVAVERAETGGARTRLPLDEFTGVAIRFDRLPADGRGLVISVNLHHGDPDLCIPVHIAFDLCDAGARWQSWGQRLKLPLLLPTPDGEWREPDDYPGKLVVRRPFARNPRQALKCRRSLFSAVRETGHCRPMPILPGTEIIART